MARTTSQNMYDGTWKHVVVILDTSQVADNEVKIYNPEKGNDTLWTR